MLTWLGLTCLDFLHIFRFGQWASLSHGQRTSDPPPSAQQFWGGAAAAAAKDTWTTTLEGYEEPVQTRKVGTGGRRWRRPPGWLAGASERAGRHKPREEEARLGWPAALIFSGERTREGEGKGKDKDEGESGSTRGFAFLALSMGATPSVAFLECFGVWFELGDPMWHPH